MRISEMSPEQRRDVTRRIARGYGEYITLTWKECPDGLDCSEKENWHEISDDFYVGKMTPGQTGTILTILIAAIINGLDFQKAQGRTDMLAFINALAGEHVNVLMGAILYQPAEWIDENFDPSWLVLVLGTFLRYNDFLTLVQQAVATGAKFGLNLESLTSLTQSISLGRK